MGTLRTDHPDSRVFIACWLWAAAAMGHLSACTTPGSADCAATRLVPDASLPRIVVTADNTRIDRSCVIVVPPGVTIADTDDDGVVHLVADDVTVWFEKGSELRGSSGEARDQYKGIGVRVDGHKGVRIVNARVSGYRAAVWATGADGLVIQNADVSGNRRDRLKSTPAAEDLVDWLWPHENDGGQWLTRYGAGVCVQRSRGVCLVGVRCREGQNGIILDCVDDSRVAECDCSFLSGWGLALWRSSRNEVWNNRFDFCIRGYSHGVYNRGQDSAGILMFEQCRENRILANSATHCGDGFFGFAGKEAMGDKPAPIEGFGYIGRGCNRNVIAGNDFSYAAAHGLELTFSFDNLIERNRLVGNAFCGVWGGYCQRMIIRENIIADNGLPGSVKGGEGGGINIEHGAENRIERNTFDRNTVAVSLWSDADEGLMKTPWAKVNHRGSRDNTLCSNVGKGNTVGLRLRDTPNTAVREHLVEAQQAEDVDDASTYEKEMGGCGVPIIARLAEPSPSTREPTGRWAELRGRQNIIIGEWGPWDHEGVLIRRAGRPSPAGGDLYEVFGARAGSVRAKEVDGAVCSRVSDAPEPAGESRVLIAVDPDESAAGSMRSYSIRVEADGVSSSRTHKETLNGVLTDIRWTGRVWAWQADPLISLAAWRDEVSHRDRLEPFEFEARALRLPFGRKGPRGLKMSEAIAVRGPGPDRFGLMASTTIDLYPGEWTIRTLSDDGVRVLVDGERVIERWDIHGPMRDEATISIDRRRPVKVDVEYFQNDGHAVLEVEIVPPPLLVPPASR